MMSDESDDDLFGAFDNPERCKIDKMAKLEEKKQIDAKETAERLLQELMAGCQPEDDTGTVKKERATKRPHEESGEIVLSDSDEEEAEKKQKIENSEIIEDSETYGADANLLEEDMKIQNLVESGDNFLEKAPSIQVHTIKTKEACIHEVCIPPGGQFKPLNMPETEPAKTYPFQLDPFQKEAILCIDNYQSVLVSAHTSAGKTVVALYAIALSLRNKQRVIYTSPIKALSNQKYRELKEEFNDVGLMTGDVTISPNASCLVMTTEILRSMLYRGSEIMREVGWVIFDEIHYMRDKERGVVWEETIILLPHEVHFVFLSATIPNASQFAEWVCYLHDHPCHVIYTEYRPTPLQHFIYPAGGSSLFEVVDTKGNFLEDKFNRAMEAMPTTAEQGTEGDTSGKTPSRIKKNKNQSESCVVKLIKTLGENDLLPVISFSFSRRECEAYASALNEIDFTDQEEKQMIREIFENSIYGLSEEDQQLTQIIGIKPFLERGIGIHHSGLLPILKEVIEMLFGEGLLKVLFATETFSMGLNMPARTVVFTAAQKFDGTDFRWLHSGEYIQMSGRAGRRGMDTKGVVVLMVDQRLNPDVAKQMLRGKPDPLNSQFRLTYNMVLNMMRVEAIYPEWMLQRSFAQFQSYGSLPGLAKKCDECQTKVKVCKVPREDELRAFHALEQQLELKKKDLLDIIRKPTYIVPLLNPGRLFRIKVGDKDFDWGCLIKYERIVEQSKTDPTDTKHIYKLLILLNFEPFRGKLDNFALEAQPAKLGIIGQPEVVPVLLDSVQAISAVKIKFPQDLTPFDSRKQVQQVINTVKQRFKDEGGPPLLHPIDDLNIKDPRAAELVNKLESLEKTYYEHTLRKDKDFPSLYEKFRRKLNVENELRVAKDNLKNAVRLLKMDELRIRQRILRRLNYCDENGSILHKGRIACEISSADELLLTELLFAGVFNELSPQNCAALLSCLIAEEKAETPPLSDELTACLRQLHEHAKRIARVSIECKIKDMAEDKYLDKFKPSAMAVVHAWCCGKSFVEISKITDMFEGSIIRTMRRLEELLREMRNAAHAIGNTALKEKFDEARQRMKRDIVFAASLYLVGEEDNDEQELKEEEKKTS